MHRAQPDEPVTTVLRGTDHYVACAQCAPGILNVSHSYVRTIRADDHHASGSFGKSLLERAAQTGAQVSASLRLDLPEITAPNSDFLPRIIRGKAQLYIRQCCQTAEEPFGESAVRR